MERLAPGQKIDVFLSDDDEDMKGRKQRKQIQTAFWKVNTSPPKGVSHLKGKEDVQTLNSTRIRKPI